MQFTYSQGTSKRKRKFGPETILVCVLIVIALSVVCFPLFVRARGAIDLARCASNLKDIGHAIELYMADHDQRWPAAVDPSDRLLTDFWAGEPERQKLIRELPLLQVPLARYIGSPNVFRCPADVGGEVLDYSFMSRPTALPGFPTWYQAFGTSYLFRTQIIFQSFEEKDYWPPDNAAILFDACGHWHGQGPQLTMDTPFLRFGRIATRYKYNTLFGDMSVKPLWFSDLDKTWQVRL